MRLRRQGGKLEFDFVKIYEDSLKHEQNVGISFADVHITSHTVNREPVAVNIIPLKDNKKVFKELIELSIKFRVKFLIEDLEELGELDDDIWGEFFNILANYDQIISYKSPLTIEEKVERVDKLIIREEPKLLRIGRVDTIPNITQFLEHLRSLNLNNFIIEKIVRLTDLPSTDAISIVKEMKVNYPSYELLLNTMDLKSKVLSTAEIIEIVKLTIKHGIPTFIDNVRSRENVYKSLYRDLYKNDIIGGIKKFIEEFGDNFLYSNELLRMYPIKLEVHPDGHGFLMHARESPSSALPMLDLKSDKESHINIEKIDNTKAYVSNNMLIGNIVYLVPEIFVYDDLTEEKEELYKNIDWDLYIE